MVGRVLECRTIGCAELSERARELRGVWRLFGTEEEEGCRGQCNLPFESVATHDGNYDIRMLWMVEKFVLMFIASGSLSTFFFRAAGLEQKRVVESIV